jgi:hypothetical protein
MSDERQFTLRQIDQARGDLYAIADDLEFLKAQLARLPNRAYFCRRRCQVNLSRSEKPEAGCAITLPPLHYAIRSSLRLERSGALIARRDGVEG